MNFDAILAVDCRVCSLRDSGSEMRRPQKAKIGSMQDVATIAALPVHLASPQAVLLDLQALREKGVPALLYVFDAGEERRGKFVVRVGFRAKGEVYNSVRSGDLTPARNLSDRTRFALITGQI